MLDAKVVASVRALSPEEKEELDLFLMSPFFVKGFTCEELRAFLKLIILWIGNPDSAGQTREIAHLNLFPDKEYSSGRIDRIMFELNRLIRVFLLTKYYHREENEIQKLLDWSARQRKNGQMASLEKQFEKQKTDLSGNGKLSLNSYFWQYMIVREEHEWESVFNRVKDDLLIPEVVRHLDLYYYTARLEYLNRFLLQQKAVSVKIPEVIEWALNQSKPPEEYISQSPVLEITNKIHELLNTPNPEPAGFLELIDLLRSHETKMSAEVLFQFYAYLRSLCTVLIDTGNLSFYEILHEINKDNLTRGYFYHADKIPPNSMLNITACATRVGDIQWAKEFIENHKNRILNENEALDFYRMNLALLYFAEGQLEKALNEIPFGSTYSFYHLMARRLELKIYYELRSELLSSKIDAFKMFISRAGSKSLSSTLFEIFSNFGNFVHQLSLSIPGDKKRSEQLIKRIQAKKLVGERGWLLEKARELGEAKKR